jgi:Ricin-type beta-trefoil lectin domain-like
MKIQNVWFVIGLLMSTTYLVAQRPSDGIYYIKTVNTAKYLGVEGVDPKNGAALVQWDFSTNDNHKFEVKNLPDGSIVLKAMHSQRYLNVEGLSMDNNARIIQWDYANQDNLKFELVQDMNGAGYFIQCFQSRKFWHLMGGNNNPQSIA